MLYQYQETKRIFWEEIMKTLSIVLASLLFVSLRLFAGEVVAKGESTPSCDKHNQSQRKSIVKDDKKEETKEEPKKLEGNVR
jgi:hypothetical protein